MTCKVQQFPRIKLLLEADGIPSFIDLLKPYGYGHIAIFATNQSGRDALTVDILAQAVSAKIPVFALDCRQANSSTILELFTHSQKGDYIHVLNEANRFFEMPKPRCAWENQEDIYHAFLWGLEETLTGFILDDRQNPFLAAKTRYVLCAALKNLFEHQKVSLEAMEGCQDSYPPQKTPNLKDFLHYCQIENIEQISELGTFSNKDFEFINQRLKLILDSKIGPAIASPMSLKTESKVKVFAVEQTLDEQEALQLQLLALNLLFREALCHRSSVVFIDDVSSLSRSDILSFQLGRLCVICEKFGVHVILRSHEVETIARSKGGRIILENIKAQLIGHIQAPDVDAFERILNLPAALIEQNARLTFKPANGYSNWLINRNGVCTSAQHQPSKSNLKLTAPVGTTSSWLK